MNFRKMSNTGNDKSTDTFEGLVGGIHYFPSTLCGDNSCSRASPHYHCQNCGYDTTELSNAVIHKESCSRFVRGRFSLSPFSQQSVVSSLPQERSFSCSLHDPGPDSTTSVSSLQSSMQITNTGNHLYYRGGSQQSSVFSPLLSGQNQPLYSGVFGSTVGYTGQNNYPSTFNSYSHVDPPLWLSDSRISSSANCVSNLDNGRTSMALSCSPQSVSHSCCGSRVNLLENIGLCSPLSSDSYKSLSKDSTNYQQKNAMNMENQNWFCGPSMVGCNSQSIQNSVYKWPEPFPSCTMSQLGIPLNEQGDAKHTGVANEMNSFSKQSLSHQNFARKSSSMEVNKDQSIKYNSTHVNDQNLDNNPSYMQQKIQESGVCDSHHILFDGELQDEMYSQGAVVLSGALIASFPYVSGISFFQTNVTETGKSFASQQCQASSTLSRCGLISCEVLEGCIQLEGQPLYQYSNVAAVSSNSDDDRVSNPGSCSGAAESDIVVEESDEEDVSEISLEDGRNSSQISCSVCSSSNAYFVHVNVISPVTSTSRIPVASKLAEVVASDCSPSMSFQNEIICKRCLNLIEAIDSLENKLASVKQSLIELYRSKVKIIKVTDISSEKAHQNNMYDNFGSASKSKSKTALDNKDSCYIEQRKLVESEKCVIIHSNDKCSINPPEVETYHLEKSLCLPSADSVKKNSKSEYVRKICEKHTVNKEYLEKHMQQHTKAFSFFCDFCGEGFMLRTGLDKHLMVHAMEYRFQCEVCGKCFVQHQVLKDHLRKHGSAFRLSCSHCKKGFMYASSLRVHERIHTGERPYICQHCGKSFICASNLTAHIRVCSGQQHFSCQHCDKKFSTSVQLKTHSITRHNSSPPLKCELCGKCFIKACDLKVHSRSHSGDKPHSCEICGKHYSSVGNLNQHAKKHCTERPFKCVLCGKGFLRKSVLERHMNQHAGNRPYKCRECNKGFISAQGLRTHSKLHTGNMKKYTCSVCGKVVKNGLKVHMRTHSGDRPYKCSECVSSFSVKSTLNKHMRLKHHHISS